jgi:hypothetical protein
MFWLDVDLKAGTTTLHREDCLHIKPEATEAKGLNEMRADGGWFNFPSVGEAMRFYKVQRLSGEVQACLYCKPLDHIGEVSMAKLDVNVPRTGCEACGTSIKVMDTKSNYRSLVERLLGEK